VKTPGRDPPFPVPWRQLIRKWVGALEVWFLTVVVVPVFGLFLFDWVGRSGGSGRVWGPEHLAELKWRVACWDHTDADIHPLGQKGKTWFRIGAELSKREPAVREQ
jgi:hypothetical protein